MRGENENYPQWLARTEREEASVRGWSKALTLACFVVIVIGGVATCEMQSMSASRASQCQGYIDPNYPPPSRKDAPREDPRTEGQRL